MTRRDLWGAVLFFAALGALAVWAAGLHREDRRFAEDGVETRATLTHLIQTETRSTGDRPRLRLRHTATVRLTLGNRETGLRTLQASAPVTGRFYRRAETGTEVPVTYLASDPGTLRIDPLRVTRRWGMVWLALGALLALPGAVLWTRRPRPAARATGAGSAGPETAGPEAASPAATGPGTAALISTAPASTGSGAADPTSAGAGATGPGSAGPISADPTSTGPISGGGLSAVRASTTPGVSRRPGWVPVLSGVLLLLCLGSFFTLSVWLRHAVEEATYRTLGGLSLPLALVAFLLPPLGLGLLNRALMRRHAPPVSPSEDPAHE